MKQRNLLLEAEIMKNMRGLYFDGRKDKTLIQVIETDGFKRQRTTREEYFSSLLLLNQTQDTSIM